MVENAPALHPDGTPQKLGRYRLIRPISTGGMARVFEGRRESLAGVAPRVAVKVILPEFSQHAGFQDLFINEARIGSLLQHQNLVQIQDFDSENGLYYLVMEYVEGVTLRRALSVCHKHGEPVPLSIVAEVGRQVADGLHAAHTATSEDGAPLGLVHRDVKPSNLILSPQGVVKVLDFGIATPLAQDERRGAVRGTWGYMAPEQADGRPVNGAADQFGLAACLYELCTGEALFPEKDPGQIRALLDADEAARRAARLGGAHAPLASVLVRALQRDPAARFPSAQVMGRALAGFVGDPVLARDHLIQFEQHVEELGRSGAPPAERPRTATSLAVPSAAPEGTGLPVAVGTHRAPHIAIPQPPPALARPAAAPRGGALVAGLIVLAVGVLGLTAWKVLVPSMPAVEVPPLRPAATGGGAPADGGAAADLAAPVEVPTAPAPVEVSPSPSPSPSPAPAPAAVVPRVAPPAEPAPAPTPVVPAPAPPVAPVEAAPAAPAPAPARAGIGALTISSIPKAQVIIDGRFVRTSPLFRHEAVAGTRTVTLIADDGRRTTFQVDVPEGGEVRRVWSFEVGGFISQ